MPTPLSKTRTPDLSYVVAAVEAVAARLVPGQLVVLQSTTVPGTTDELLVSALERATGGTVGRDFFVGYAPERVDPANKAGWTLHTTPKLVSGVTPECARRTALLFEQVCETVIPCGSPRVAELAKLYENTFRQVNIALANELALMCQRLGVSAWEVIDAAATKPFGFLPHYPGPGLGGDCIPVVPHFLSYRLRECGYQTRMIDAAHEINTAMPELRRRARDPGAERSRQGGARRADPALRGRLQAERLRPARVAGARDLRGAPAPRRPARLRRSARRERHRRRLRVHGRTVERGDRRERRRGRDADARTTSSWRPRSGMPPKPVVDTRNVVAPREGVYQL